MTSLEGIRRRLFENRRYLDALYSDAPGMPCFQQLAAEMTVLQLPSELAADEIDAATEPLTPFLIVEWDLTFDRDVEPENIQAYMASYDEPEDGVGYHYQVGYLNTAGAHAFQERLLTLLADQGRRLDCVTKAEGTVLSCTCRRAERLVRLYFGLPE